MKRLLLLLLLIPFVLGAAGDVALINGKAITAVASVVGKANAAILTIGGKPCADGDAACSTPTADVASEGFEGCAADGSSGCDETWATTGTGLTYNYSLPGTPPTGSCSKGLQVNTDGADYATYDNSTALETVWTKFTIYVTSESFAAYATGTVFTQGESNGTGGGIYLQLYDNNGTFQIRANNGSAPSTGTNLSTGEWHTIEICSTDGGIGSDPCSAGTNGYGWFKVDGGDPVTHPCKDTVGSAHRYTLTGMITASRTADIIFGYIIIDDDGTY
jgi:hypothetical protein